MCEGIVPGEMHLHVVAVSPHGRLGVQAATGNLTATTTAAGASTAEMRTTMCRDDSSADTAVTISVSGGEGVGVGDMKKAPPSEPCFPACMDMDSNQKTVRVVDESVDANATEDASSASMATRSGRRSRRNSRRLSLSLDNQSESKPSLDLEDAAQSVLSPVDTRSHSPASSSIVVDYDEGMPERSRTGFLLREQVRDRGAVADCAPDACNPLDALAFDELAIEDMAMASTSSARIATRPRLGSASQPPKTPRSPKTPSRRGKSIVLSSTAITLEAERPLAAVNVPPLTAETKPTEENDGDRKPERCSQLHKLCLCEVRLHTSRESCWLVASGSVYDVTGLVDVHPAGPRSILRKAGGTDCTKDMKFHSKAARKMMQKCFIGKLVPCGDDADQADAPAACTIM